MDDLLELESPSSPSARAYVVTRASARYAIAADDVVEMIAPPRLTRVPLAPPHVLGVFAHAGAAIALLEPAPGASAPPQCVVLVRTAGAVVGIAADSIAPSGEQAMPMLDIEALVRGHDVNSKFKVQNSKLREQPESWRA